MVRGMMISLCHKELLSILTACLSLVTLLAPPTSGHGRLLNPPSRQSAWREGFKTFVNYDDHGRNCGGRGNQWENNGGRCGICGDPAQGPRDYERPDGRAVQGELVLTRNYIQGQTVDVRVDMAVNHLGWFEFRVCDIATTGGVEATQDCLDQNLLADATGETRFQIPSPAIGYYDYRLILPASLVCQHCLIQWKWKCGNSPGYGEAQEEFYACSDVSISSSGGALPTPQPPSIATMFPTVATQAPSIATPFPTIATPAPTIATLAPTIATPSPAIATPSPTIATPSPTIATPAPTPPPTVATPAPTVATPAPTIATKAPTIATKSPTMSTSAPTTMSNDDLLGYFQGQRTKRPISPVQPGAVQPPRPMQPGRSGVSDTNQGGYNTLCTTCLGNGCRYAGCNILCRDVCH